MSPDLAVEYLAFSGDLNAGRACVGNEQNSSDKRRVGLRGGELKKCNQLPATNK